ncbi:hypothetical protein BJ875DRAFT_489040 [Amylocarpus encephaloides]|uniref:Uncharacterized protein n=1 Tax=Amylocarpus encephaloides TaxID=45428 RepID=A0A9P8C0W0_9HELO|nr:hypothetical protein BJ875DRAFT_489040 [Amylocarpus encephaloides]
MVFNFQFQPHALPLVPEGSQTFNAATVEFLEEQRSNLNHSIQDEYCTDENGNWNYQVAEIYSRVEHIEQPAAENSPNFNRSIRQQILCIHDDLRSLRKLPFGGLRTVFPHLIPDFGSSMLLDSDEPLKWYRVPAQDPDTQFLLDRLANEVAFPEPTEVQASQNSGAAAKLASPPNISINSNPQISDTSISRYGSVPFSNPSADFDTYSSERENINLPQYFATSSPTPANPDATARTHRFGDSHDHDKRMQRPSYHQREQSLSEYQVENERS